MRKPVFGVSDQVDTNRAVKSQKMVRSLKFWIKKEDGSHYLCSEDKGADQLCSYCTADLRLCFCKSKNPVFLRHGSKLMFQEKINHRVISAGCCNERIIGQNDIYTLLLLLMLVKEVVPAAWWPNHRVTDLN